MWEPQHDIIEGSPHFKHLLPPIIPCQMLRGIQTKDLDMNKMQVISDSSAFYSWNYKFPRIILTKCKDVRPEWPPGFRSNFRKFILPTHRNKGGRLGAVVKRGIRSDFKWDMQNRCYGFGFTFEGNSFKWNNRQREYCDKACEIAVFLSAHVRQLIPGLWRDMKNVAAKKKVPLIPGTICRAFMVSFNYESVLHLDERDKHCSILVVLKPEGVTGGKLVFPEYGLSFRLDDGDVLIFWGQYNIHGTSKMYFVDDNGKVFRIGIVMYM